MAMAFGKRLATHFPKHRSEIAVGLAILATALGIGSILYCSSVHVALTLLTVAILWNMAADLLASRDYDFLKAKSIPDIYRYFRAGGQIQRGPVERVLERGAFVMMAASVISLFTLTTW